MKRHPPLALLAAAALAACSDDTLRAGEPLAQLDAAPACVPETPTACLDFGLVEAGRTAAGALKFGSGTTTAVSLTSARVEGPDAARFVLAPLELPAVVAGASTLELALTFAPVYTPGDAAHPWSAPRELYRASVVVQTDDPLRPELRADLVGRSSVGWADVEPEAIQFGRVAIGATRGVQALVLTNEGDVPLVFPAPPSFDAAAAAAGFQPATSFNLTRLEPGQRVQLALAFSPSAQGLARGALVLDSSDPRGRLLVPLSGEGVQNSAPSACLGLARVFDRFGRERARNGVGSYSLEPLDRAIVTARPASDGAANATCPDDSADPDRDPVTFRWEPVGAPSDSHATLEPYSAHQQLQAWQRELFVDREGDFTTIVVVTENNGVGLATRAPAVWRVAGRGIAATLDWGAPDASTVGADLDLHLVRPAWAGESFPEPRLCTGASGPDCYWGSCKLTVSGRSPLDWGGTGPDDASDATSEQLANDPLIAHDSTGEAPLREHLSIPGPVPGEYDLYVHFFEDSRAGRPGQVPFRLSLTLGDGGARIVEGTLAGEGTLYRVGTIRWPADGSGARLDSTRAGLLSLTQCR